MGGGAAAACGLRLAAAWAAAAAATSTTSLQWRMLIDRLPSLPARGTISQSPAGAAMAQRLEVAFFWIPIAESSSCNRPSNKG